MACPIGIMNGSGLSNKVRHECLEKQYYDASCISYSFIVRDMHLKCLYITLCNNMEQFNHKGAATAHVLSHVAI